MTHQVKLDKTGAFVGKTHKKNNKKTGEEKCVNETEDVRKKKTKNEREKIG